MRTQSKHDLMQGRGSIDLSPWPHIIFHFLDLVEAVVVHVEADHQEEEEEPGVDEEDVEGALRRRSQWLQRN